MFVKYTKLMMRSYRGSALHHNDGLSALADLFVTMTRYRRAGDPLSKLTECWTEMATAALSKRSHPNQCAERAQDVSRVLAPLLRALNALILCHAEDHVALPSGWQPLAHSSFLRAIQTLLAVQDNVGHFGRGHGAGTTFLAQILVTLALLRVAGLPGALERALPSATTLAIPTWLENDISTAHRLEPGLKLLASLWLSGGLSNALDEQVSWDTFDRGCCLCLVHRSS
jgi:hypothetical protein